jgi:hypothetical protein
VMKALKNRNTVLGESNAGKFQHYLATASNEYHSNLKIVKLYRSASQDESKSAAKIADPTQHFPTFDSSLAISKRSLSQPVNLAHVSTLI